MELDELKEKFKLYAKHGGSWYYIKTQLIKANVPNDLADLVVDYVQSSKLGTNNQNTASDLFDALIFCIKKNNFESYEIFKTILQFETAIEWLEIHNALKHEL